MSVLENLRPAPRARDSRATGDLDRSVVDAVPVPLLVLDPQGQVNQASRSWTSVVRCANCPDAVQAGDNYLEGWAHAPRERVLASKEARDGLRSVLAGRCDSFETVYHCAHDLLDCHIRVEVSALGDGKGAVVVQTDVGELEGAKADLERIRAEMGERVAAESGFLQRAALRANGCDGIVGTSAALAKTLRQIEQVAGADSPVLILGETGTGKDLVARSLHERSRRKNRPLIVVNCAALPDALIESELFGYEKGAFTGAVTRSLGRFEAAHGGSILLDEVGEFPLGAQAKLLRVLEAGTFERLGSSRTTRVDVRVIAATNRDLEKEVREGRFRADLYYRLNVFPIAVSSLRERTEDIPLLAWHFINAKQVTLGRRIERVPERLMQALTAYAWPGNVRELENVIERALIVSNGPTLAIDAAFLGTAGGPAPASGARLDDVQRAHIEEVLRQCDWKVAGRGNAAERLGLKRGTLQFRMKKLGIERRAAVSG